MAVWELIEEALNGAHAAGRAWLTRGEVVDLVLARAPVVNKGTIAAHASAMCINDPHIYEIAFQIRPDRPGN